MSNITIRLSLPSDAEQVVPLIYSSGPDAFDYVFKSRHSTAIDFLKFAFVRSGGEFGFQNHHTILLDDKVVGVGAVFTGNEMLGFTWSVAKKIIKFYKLGCFRIIINGLKIETLIKPPNKREVAIGHIGIHESARGLGLGTQLIKHLMNNSKIKDEAHYVLDVSSENSRAQSLYEKLGYVVKKVCVSNLSNNYVKIVNHHRMHLKIK